MAAPAPQEPVIFHIPKLPTESVGDFVPYVSKHPDTPLTQLLEPYKAFESELRKIYAQEPTHEAVCVPNVNLVPIFNGHEKEIIVRARSLETESEEEKAQFIMPLDHKERKISGSPAVVTSFKEFQKNFNLFSESSLIDLDWDNVVAAGSSVTTSLLPVPEKWAGSKRSMREYYHETLAPASDVDLFLYGMNEEQALEKIKQIEQRVKDSILHEVTTIRTKNAITIASQYPTRHIQIVLRLYDSVSQIITGFDVDCACVAYDGKQVYAAPRAIAAFMTQCNTIDLSRRSPSYENRLSKYSHRGFEVHWPLLDRTRIDPTIFERSFGRTQGLARLLILEKLPKVSDRDSYMAQRREERGRPALNRWRNQFNNSGNLKEQAEDEVSDWIEQQDVSSYHSMTVPYGPKYGAARITRLLYAKDLLLNAEWNQPRDREVYLHRHPCFFTGTSGSAEDILQDCCGYCPFPQTDEEIEVAEEEGKTNVSGALQFMKDDPGRQAIGSFNPITDDEWTTMAYVGDTARLCQAIVDHDIEHVQDWLQQEGVDVNRRDFVGRTPLHLATMTSTPEIVQLLIDHNARIVARLQDGRTALHIAASRGNADMVKALMDKSLENEVEEDEKREARLEAKKAERRALRQLNGDEESISLDEIEDTGEESSISEITLDSDDSDSMTMGSFVRVSTTKEVEDDAADSTDEPDVYDVDVIAWDYNLSPLHCAIINGHLHIIELLVSEYGSDVMLPVKLIDMDSKNARGAIMTIVLALFLPTPTAEKVVKLLLQLGASSAQGDTNHITAFHYLVSENKHNLLDVLLTNDKPAAISIVNNIGFTNYNGGFTTPLLTAVERSYYEMVSTLLSIGAKPEISFDDWIKVYLEKCPWARNNTSENNMTQYRSQSNQPVISAANLSSGSMVELLVANGADPSTLDSNSYGLVHRKANHGYYYGSERGNSLLDIIQRKLKELRDYGSTSASFLEPPETLEEEEYYTKHLAKGTYKHWTVTENFRAHKAANQILWKNYKKSIEDKEVVEGEAEKKTAIGDLIKELETTEATLIAAGAKPFSELHPELSKTLEEAASRRGYTSYSPPEPPKPQPYTPSLSFLVPDLNTSKKIGYSRLFEAAWVGDLDMIKSLTLAPWASKDESGIPPLQIAVRDFNGFSPFSIAVLRGHFDLARNIVSIAMAQYHKDDNKDLRQRWTMNTDDSEDEDCDDENVLPIFSELINDRFTVDNLGEVSTVVKSTVLPSAMMEWPCKAGRFDDSEVKDSTHQLSLQKYAVVSDNMQILKFIIDLGAEEQALLAEEPDDQRCYSMDTSIFELAIKLGRTSMIAEMIGSTGVGIPLTQFVQNSGVEAKSKPKYYQGLSVGGKKRADWAEAPHNHSRVQEYSNNPLLEAASHRSLESVEWFMSDAPLRRYKAFAAKNESDKRIKTLRESEKGFDRTVGTFLNAKSELLLHFAVLSRSDNEAGLNSNVEDEKQMALIKHIVSVAPETLEQKSSKGYTPLQLAILTNRNKVASYLISIGANQRHRDRSGRNMLHSMVATLHHHRKNAAGLQNIISLFNEEAIEEMLVERTSQPESATPLAYWMLHNGNSFTKPDIIAVLAKYSSGEDLTMINSEGDLPLHFAIKKGLSSITSFLLSQNPTLLYRENSTGRTPLEMSREIYHASCVKDPISISTSRTIQSSHPNSSILSRAPATFLPDSNEPEPEESKKRTFEICMEMDEKMAAEGGDRKRRLVSLNEASEVAKRVGLRSGGRRYGGSQAVINGGLVDGEGVDDVVSSRLMSMMGVYEDWVDY